MSDSAPVDTWVHGQLALDEELEDLRAFTRAAAASSSFEFTDIRDHARWLLDRWPQTAAAAGEVPTTRPPGPGTSPEPNREQP